MRRLTYVNLPNIDDLIDMVYGSKDFRTGVRNFLDKGKTPPEWRGK
jgi:hypothetical protein